MKSLRFILIPVLCFFLTSCQFIQGTPNQPALPSPILLPNTNTNLLEVQPYQNLLAKFQINIPKSWAVNENVSNGTVALIYDPKLQGDFNPNINIAVQQAAGAPLTKLVEDSKKSNTTYLTDYKITSEKDFTVNETQGYLLDATFTQGQTQLFIRQLLLMHQDTAFVITAKSKTTDWTTFEPIAHATLLTFKPY